MRSLEEVRKAFEYCLTPERGCASCPAHIDRQKPCYIWGEALFYLNEYATSLNNEPLTWTELQQMEGKPVWIEDTYCKFYGWEKVERLGTNKWLTGEFLETNGGLYRKEDQGESWQAYRKERH